MSVCCMRGDSARGGGFRALPARSISQVKVEEDSIGGSVACIWGVPAVGTLRKWLGEDERIGENGTYAEEDAKRSRLGWTQFWGSTVLSAAMGEGRQT